MDLFQLRIFSLAAKYLNFSKVASALFISPPSVTKYIATLEKEVNHPLFVRNGHQVELTNFGESFLFYVNELLEKEDEVNRFLKHVESGFPYLIVGIIPNLSTVPQNFYRSFFKAKNRFERSHAGIEIRAVFMEYPELQASLTIRDVDLALFPIPNREIPHALPEKMCYRKLNHFSHTLVVPSKSSGHQPLDQAAKRIATLTYVDTPASRDLARNFTTQYRIAPRLIPVRFWGDALMRTVSGDCAMVITENLKETIAGFDVDLYELDDDTYSTGLYALWWCDRGAHLDELAEYLAQSMYGSK